MKDEELETLSFDSFDEDEFMLNNKEVKEEKEELKITEDDIIDTILEKDYSDKIEIMEDVTPVIEEEKEKLEKKATKEKKTKKEKKEKKVKREKKKGQGFKFPVDKKGRVIYICQAIFCLLSALFIIACCVFYGSRLLKYYRIYNPKTEDGQKIELIGTSIATKATYVTEGEGVYQLGGSSIYKGENVDNYILFANHMWRIISINTDGSLEITTDDYINALSFGDKVSNFKDSDLNAYLNDFFLKTLNKDYLSATSYCLDEVEDIVEITCNNIVTEDYVRLLGVSEVLNSKVDGKTYLNNDEDFWIYNTSTTGAWHTSGSGFALADTKDGYLVKPVVRIKNSAQLLGGSGTKEDPYYFEEIKKDTYKIGDYVKLGEDTWVVYEVKEKTVNLALDNNLSYTYRFSLNSNKYDTTSNSSLALYLNDTYLNSLTYKDVINDNEWFIGAYNGDYQNVYKEKTTAKVGLYNVLDLKVGNTLETYYLLTPSADNYVYLYNSGLIESKVTLVRNIKPTININKLTIKSGTGTLEDPYMLEV